MDCHIAPTRWTEAQADWLIVGIPDGEWSAPLNALNEALGSALTRLKEAGDLSGNLADLVPLRFAPGIAARRLMLVGLGKPSEFTPARLDKAFTTAARAVSDKKDTAVAVALPSDTLNGIALDEIARIAATAFNVGCVGQTLYRAEPGRFTFKSVTLLAPEGGNSKSITDSARRGSILGEAMNLTRELVNRGPHEIYPESFADRARGVARECGLACDVFDQDRLRAERMEAMLAVAQGSTRPARMVVVEHKGAGDGKPTLALVGKGVTFDSGGLSIKPSEGMSTMKSDMAGAATVLGAMSAIARLKLPVNVTGYMGLVENMPGGSAFKLGDILTARNGVTIEVLNTDAEGRLVLADVLSYAVDRGADRVIDLATLTGACVVALGEDVTGAFTNHEEWQNAVLASAKRCGEDVWPLPMFDLYSELIKSDVADIKNIGGRWGGAITAAKFLERFVAGKPWVHLDIAGPSFASSNKPHREGGGTGVMVRTLVDVAQQFSTNP